MPSLAKASYRLLSEVKHVNVMRGFFGGGWGGGGYYEWYSYLFILLKCGEVGGCKQVNFEF